MNESYILEQIVIYFNFFSKYMHFKLILIYFMSIVKQALFCLCKSRSNPFLEPTSTK